MKSAMTKRMLAVLGAVVLLAAACGNDSEVSAAAVQDGVEAVVDSEDDGMMGEADHDLNLVQSDLGQILTDEAGFTVYLFTNDEQGSGASSCLSECMGMWPPVGEITSPSGALEAGLVGTIERPDGSIQATYNGWPLYNFANDAAEGDTNGQGVNDIWWVLDVDGNAVDAPV